MADGTRLAADVWLPNGGAARPGPTILRQTRYFRRVARRTVGRALPVDQFDLYWTTRQKFLALGYAWVDVDVRGTGASFGSWWLPWSPDEGRDGATVVDWITRQPWSDGAVGLMGISYDGTTAEQTAAEGHPAVKALAARYAVWDVYADIAFPGGLFHEHFLRAWGAMNQELDRHAMGKAAALIIQMSARGLTESMGSRGLQRALTRLSLDDDRHQARLARFFGTFVDGVFPVDDDPLGEARARSLERRHENFDVYASARRIRHRDDEGFFDGDPNIIIDSFSPHVRRDAIARTGIPILSESGWFDGSYGGAAIKRFTQVRNAGSRLLLGPWDHGGRQHVGPGLRARPTQFDHDAELVAFFESALGREEHSRETVRYWQYGDETWRTAETWPPPGLTTHTLFLGADRRLSTEPASAPSHDAHTIDHGVGSGLTSRWRSLVGLTLPTGYARWDRHEGRRLAFTGAPEPRDLVLVGSPRLRLRVAADAADAAVFVYLEMIAPSGALTLLTEGGLRLSLRGEAHDEHPTFTAASRRPLVPHEPVDATIELLPIAIRVPAGARLRLSIAGADADHFETVGEASTLVIVTPGSSLELPVEPPHH